jgi:hypothetical protein
MRLGRGAIIAVLLMGVLTVTPAYAGTADEPECHIEFHRGKATTPRIELRVRRPRRRPPARGPRRVGKRLR